MLLKFCLTFSSLKYFCTPVIKVRSVWSVTILLEKRLAAWDEKTRRLRQHLHNLHCSLFIWNWRNALSYYEIRKCLFNQIKEWQTNGTSRGRHRNARHGHDKVNQILESGHEATFAWFPTTFEMARWLICVYDCIRLQFNYFFTPKR